MIDIMYEGGVPMVKPLEGVSEKTKTHPCYNECGSQYARMHIPVAPKCNISCNYCNRQFDCLHESRPGVTSEVLSPEQALEKYKVVKEKVPNLTVVGIAGPGDALANYEQTRESLRLIREFDPEVTFCLSTNGLRLPEYAEELIELGVTHITVTMNTLRPEVGAKLYKQIHYQGKTYIGVEGARILIENQLEGIKKVCELGALCKVNIVYVKGINDEYIEEVVKKVKEFGVFMTNIMPLIPAKGSVFEDMPKVSNVELQAMRKKCEIDLKQMYHCKQCRADAIGQLSQDRSIEFRNCSSSTEKKKTISWKFAVASKTGRLIDAHFGHVNQFYIYEYTEEGLKFLETRESAPYCSGGEECEDSKKKFEQLYDMLQDCQAVLCMRIGESPKQSLLNKEIQVIETYDKIEEGIMNVVKEWQSNKMLKVEC